MDSSPNNCDRTRQNCLCYSSCTYEYCWEALLTVPVDFGIIYPLHVFREIGRARAHTSSHMRVGGCLLSACLFRSWCKEINTLSAVSHIENSSGLCILFYLLFHLCDKHSKIVVFVLVFLCVHVFFLLLLLFQLICCLALWIENDWLVPFVIFSVNLNDSDLTFHSGVVFF